MARARLLKPDFFRDEELAELSSWARLLFAGLWTIADREGRLEYRVKRINADIFPFDDDVDVDSELVSLSNHFITIYQVKGRKYIQINNFHKHQHPHQNEPSSILPSMDDAKQESLLTMVEAASDNVRSHSGSIGINSGVGVGNNSGSGIPPKKAGKKSRTHDPIWDTVEAEWWAGGVPEPSRKRVGKIVRDLKALNATPEDIADRIAAYRAKWPTMDCTPEAIIKHWCQLNGHAATVGGALSEFTPEELAKLEKGESLYDD